MTVLECSSKGDKRFSAFYAKVSVYDTFDSIENHYQLSKRFVEGDGKKIMIPTKWEDSKGKTPDFFVVHGIEFPVSYLPQYYKLLWVKYLDASPALVKYASQFDEFVDMFRGRSQNCQADVVKQYVKEGRGSILKECVPLICVLNQGGFVSQVDGDLLTCKKNIIGHQVNCLGVMGAGLAKSIKSRYPEVFEEYVRLCNEHHKDKSLLGMCQIVSTKEKGRLVANLFGQHSTSRDAMQTEYDELEKALFALKKEAMEKNLSVGLPYQLGSGLGGGSWEKVKEIIKRVFTDYPVTIYRRPDLVK